MPEIGTSGLMSGDGKRGDGQRPKPPRPSSTLPNVWSGRALQEGLLTLADASCINVFGLRLEHVLRAIMDISAHAIFLADRPRQGLSGHQGSHAPGRPILHCPLILSQNSAG